MAIRKSADEELVVAGSRQDWLDRCVAALKRAGFKDVESNATLGQVSGHYRKMTTHGELLITLMPDGDQQTKMKLRATANIDNIYALVRSPTGRIISEFKTALA